MRFAEKSLQCIIAIVILSKRSLDPNKEYFFTTEIKSHRAQGIWKLVKYDWLHSSH